MVRLPEDARAEVRRATANGTSHFRECQTKDRGLRVPGQAWTDPAIDSLHMDVSRQVVGGEDRSAHDLDRVAEVAARLEGELAKAIIGQQRVIREILIAFLAGGHCLLRGVPGLAKTLLIKKLAQAVDLKFNRIQFTPDLMPSDILGAEVIEEDRTTGRRVIRFIRGPVFANILLADEINRTPPKTQAALLEAMQEYQITVNGARFPLDRPLFVLATQNPIEQEGTYPLPEAQLDRFMFNVVIDYPSADEDRQIPAQT